MRERPMLWLRHEVRPGERRAALAPPDARRLVEKGFTIVVEDSPTRAFPLSEYVEAGCESAPVGSWPQAPEAAIILGLKELPPGTHPLRDHIYFAHAYKHQAGAGALLRRFVAGGGTLLDLEYLVGSDGRRVAAFGYWAGYVGAALAVLEYRGTLPDRLEPMDRASLDALLAPASGQARTPRALVLGYRGRSGRGACDALAVAGITPRRWGKAQTASLDKAVLLGHDILVNAVFVDTPIPPFVTPADLDAPDRALSVIADVTCDVTSECNVLPIYDEVTTWQEPVRVLREGPNPVRIIAIDNLPSLLPLEATRTYSADLLPTLATLPDGAVWRRARARFAQALDDEGVVPEGGAPAVPAPVVRGA